MKISFDHVLCHIVPLLSRDVGKVKIKVLFLTFFFVFVLAVRARNRCRTTTGFKCELQQCSALKCVLVVMRIINV